MIQRHSIIDNPSNFDVMQKAKQLPPRSSGSMKKANASRMAGIRKVWLFVMLLVSVSTGARAQFTIDNQTPCGWPVRLYCSYYKKCFPLYSPVLQDTMIVDSIPANTTIFYNLASYYPFTNCRVYKVEVKNYRYHTWTVVGDNPNCGYNTSSSAGPCPYNGIFPVLQYYQDVLLTIQ